MLSDVDLRLTAVAIRKHDHHKVERKPGVRRTNQSYQGGPRLHSSSV